MNTHFFKAHKFPLLWALVILVLTLLPGKYIPKVDYWNVLSLDKYVHIGIFFIQTILLLYSQKLQGNLSWKTYLMAILLGVSYGVMIEFIQQFIPLRSFEWNDMVANTFGATLAGGVFYIFKNK